MAALTQNPTLYSFEAVKNDVGAAHPYTLRLTYHAYKGTLPVNYTVPFDVDTEDADSTFFTETVDPGVEAFYNAQGYTYAT